MTGFNGTVLAYGQTSAGKSWTMEGPSIWDTASQGIIPRSCLLYTSPSPRDRTRSRMPSSA